MYACHINKNVWIFLWIPGVKELNMSSIGPFYNSLSKDWSILSNMDNFNYLWLIIQF